MTAPTTLRAEHPAELAEVLEFIHEWLSVNRDCPWPCQSPRWWPGKVLAVVSR